MKIMGLCMGLCAVLLFGMGAVQAEQIETLLGFSTDFDKGEITIEVAGSGCTQAKDFRFEFKDNVLTVFRKQRDACKAMPRKTSFTFKLGDLGIGPHKRFRMANPFVVNHNLTNL
ncbi:MAG: hypothetical protein EHM45_23530 [Desulfobacteraceae bacterium]|nr:MAG: hypothetical protein EHM45_23530 [Desulfobacteraceae bacterium]